MTTEWLDRPSRHDDRDHLLASPMPLAWASYLRWLPAYRALDERGQHRLGADTRVLVAEKHWHGRGLLVTDAIKVVVAAQAALLLLNIEHDYYPRVTTILLYPSSYDDHAASAALGAVAYRQLGEARRDGTVVLAWDAAARGSLHPRDGHNLVLHEFAHQLDLEDGQADGHPPLPARLRLREWTRVLDAHLRQLREQAAQERITLLDRYGAANRAEFFAVATECFFERSRELAQQHPELYLLLWRYYGQDPAARA